MKKIAFLFFLLFFLTACSDPARVVTSQNIVIPGVSPEMFNCPTIEVWPNPDELTDLQVARLLVELRRNNVICRNSIVAIQEFLRRASEVTTSPQ
jgi:hypothetical protein